MIGLIWNALFGWMGIGLTVAVGAAAVAVLLPVWLSAIIPNLRVAAIVVAVLAGTTTIIYGKGYSDGADEVRDQWEDAKSAAVKRAEKARSDAERGVAKHPAPSVRDKFNRD
jgi:hypothetical protein